MKGSGTSPSGKWIAVIGDRLPGFEPQDTIHGALGDAAGSLGFEIPDVRWIPTDLLESEGPKVLDGAAAVWCAPGSPFRSLDGALSGIRWARESRIPFLGTCAGFQHGAIEYARNMLGRQRAAHGEYESPSGSDLFIEELLCSLVGKTMEVEVVDSELLAVYGDPCPKERYYCRFGLNPTWRSPLEEGGLLVAGVDADDGDVRVMRLADYPFFVLTLFVPQTSSSPNRPHPLILGLLRKALA